MDYIGFTFNKVHSSELGIVRTSDGSRFNENLLPSMQDKTTPIPGRDGTYFFGGSYTQRVFDISFAFDSLTEEQYARLKSWLGDKKIHNLIFDEQPYKVYKAKITGTATIKHIPFGEGPTNRIYKGEGAIQFTAFEPFARSVYKYADEYEVDNFEEWKGAAKLLSTRGNYDRVVNNSIRLYNPGDQEADFVLAIKFDGDTIPATKIRLEDPEGFIRGMDIDSITKLGEDDCVKINSKLNLIEGYANNKKTGNVYNRYISAGDFFKIPMFSDTKNDMLLTIEGSSHLVQAIEYDYLYF